MNPASLVRFSALVAWRRSLADWRLQLASAFGVVLAVTLMAAGVVYSHALEETAFSHTLDRATDEDVNVRVRVFHALETPLYSATRRFVEERVGGRMEPYVKEELLLIQTSTLFFKDLQGAATDNPTRPRATLQTVTDMQDHSTLVEGRYPEASVDTLEVVVDRRGATLLNLSVGETTGVFSALSEDESKVVSVRIVGIIEPDNPSSQYWTVGSRDRLGKRAESWISVALYTNVIELFSNVEEAIPALDSDFVWLFEFDRQGVRASQAQELHRTVTGVVRQVRTNLPNSTLNTGLDGVLERYMNLLVLARIPLFLILFLAVAVLLYYLFLIAGLLGRLRAEEVAIYRSRGASTWQVGIVILLEGLIMAVPAVAGGPFLAQALVQMTGRVSPGTEGAPGLGFVDLSPPVFMMGALGGLVAVLVLTVSTLSTAGRGIVALRSSSARPPELPFFLRYYLDMALLAIIGLLWWQLKTRGSFLIRPVYGEEVSFDITLLLGPVLAAVAVGLVVLRVFPLLMRAIGKIIDPIGSVWLVQALRRIGRDPVPTGSILVLVALATSLGVLSSAVLSTLERSQRDQARYQAGADLRFQHSLREEVAYGRSPVEELRGLPVVEEAADVVRIGTRVSTASFGQSVSLVGVDSALLSDVVWRRADITGERALRAMEVLEAASPAPGGLQLPDGATALGIWVRPGRVSGSPILFARLQDGEGTYFDMAMGPLDGKGWYHLEAPIKPYVRPDRANPPPSPRIAPPYTLHTLWVGSKNRGQTIGTLFLDELQAITSQGPEVVDPFQDTEGWHPIEDPLGTGLYSLDISESVARPGRRSVVFQWGRGGLAARGLRFGPPERPLPVLVSESFMEETPETEIGNALSISLSDVEAPIEIAGTLPYFPTLYPRETPFVIADVDSVMRFVALHSPRPRYPATEAWVQGDVGGLSTPFITAMVEGRGGTVSNVYRASALVADRVADPLLAGGWGGLLALSFVSVVLASASGLLLYTYIDAREHVGEYAVLRTVGFTSFQVNGVLWFNLAITVVLGALLGTWGGQMLGNAILPLLEIAEGGKLVTPPMVLQNNSPALISAYLVLAAATIVTVGILAWAISRLEVQRILRMAEA